MAMSMPSKAWTLEELHRLPDDGNKYEVIRGELFVTPPPSVDHEEVLTRLSDILAAYVRQHGLGRVYHPRSVVRFEGSEAEPDLMVRAVPAGAHGNAWEKLPAPLLVVEVMSPTTRRRDLVAKREYYLDAGAGEYWVVDGERREIRVVRRGAEDVIARESVVWPAAAAEPLLLDVASLFA
jgi:Uma2 family endonuclease